MKHVLRLLKPVRGKIALFALVLLTASLCSLALPTIMGMIVDEGIKPQNFDIVWKYSVIMVAVAACGFIMMFIGAKLSTFIMTKFTGDMRTQVYEHALDLPLSELSRIGNGALLTRSTQDIGMIQEFLSMFMSAAVTVPIMIIGGCTLAFMRDWLMALIILLVSPLIIVLTMLIGKKLQPLFKKANQYIDKQNTIVRERLSGIRVIRAYDCEEKEHTRIKVATEEMADNLIKANVSTGVLAPIALLIMNLVTVLILYLGAESIKTSTALQVGDLVAILQYVSLIMSAIFNSAFVLIWMPRIKVSLDRIGEVFATKRIKRSDTPIALSGTIEGTNVSYCYPDGTADALKPLDFSIAEGERVAFIGGTGSGKSTLLNLFTGLTCNTGGSLKIGGKELGDLTVDEVCGAVTTVFQKNDIFSGTVRDNLDPMHEHTDEEIMAALDEAQFGDFVRQRSLEYVLSQSGNNLSGGQKQRLCIARAFLKKANIYLFDDSFSALDYITEKKVRAAMNVTLDGKTMIIATQRVSTARNCDKIFVFDQGEMIACGTHDTLLKDCKVYNEIYVSQTGGEL